ncbi:MAG: chromate transporter [Streptosporangiaceae bacterium]
MVGDRPAEDAGPGLPPAVPLRTIAREWGRIGCIGFGGPPAHIALLRQLCVEDRGWLPASEFEDGVAACNLMPGPASTQLAIFCAWRLRGPAGALIGGLCFIVPGLIIILGLAAVFLAQHPPGWIRGAADGAGAAVPAVAVAAAVGLVPASWRRLVGTGGRSDGTGGVFRWRGGAGRRRVPADPAIPGGPGGSPARDEMAGGPGGSSARDEMAGGPGGSSPGKARWVGYALAGGVAAATVGPWLVLVLAACGLAEVAATTPRPWPSRPGRPGVLLPLAALAVPATGGLLAVAWVAFKVGALSYGGGFVIIPLMQHDAVHTYHWMTAAQFLDAVALGQVTPGPVVQTVAVVGYAVHGVGGGLLASAVAFTPSFAFVLVGGRYFDRLRANQRVQAFLTGAGPAAIGAIAGAAIPLALALAHLWQFGLLALAAAWLVALRRGVVSGIVGAAGLGVLAFLAGAPVG